MKFVTAALLTFVALGAEPFQGRVVDAGGKPVAGAKVIHGSWQIEVVTDRDGRFSVPLPPVLVRKPGYVSVFAKRSGDLTVVVLQNALPNGGRLRRCRSAGKAGFTLGFEEVPGMRVSKDSRDADYVARSYRMGGDETSLVLHGSGANWAWGFPSPQEIEAEGFEERMYLRGNSEEIFDYRGRDRDGVYFRSVGRLGETAKYRTKDLETARRLDGILDGVCSVGVGQR